MGIIDTLTAGYDLVRRRLWLLVLPLVLDIGLWLAPKLSVFTLLRGLWRTLLANAAASGVATSTLLGNANEILPDLAAMARELDLAVLLPLSSLGVPVLPMTGTTSFFGLTKQAIELQGGLALLLVMASLVLGGLFIGAAYMALIAHIVRDGQVHWRELVRQVPRYWLRLIGAGLLLLAGIMIVALPASMIISLFGLFSPTLASLLMGLLSFFVFWMMIYMVFVPQAIVFSHDGALKSIWRSAIMVRTSFWPALGLFLLSYVITTGLAFVWDFLTVSAPGALVAMVASAFVGTGLTAALFVFYRERLRALAGVAPHA
ncbi:MAG TPA: hypothetical protein PLJ35_03655 [Anaerolineae bacterium]|nr:hypothetical protein [Anaerolineae bacterium]HOQ97898.1 hypothetical protein [Anaerolineae bacterium]HPL26716.1 hypothetical protein [Anaerolineae bacterium]